MGVQSMYQKFYAARSPKDAKTAVAIWIVGTIVVESIVIAIAAWRMPMRKINPDKKN